MADDDTTADEKQTITVRPEAEFKDPVVKEDKAEDVELNELLDSALEDFGKSDVATCNPAQTQTSEKSIGNDDAAADAAARSSSNQTESADAIGLGEDDFSEEMSEQMAKQFEDAMKSFMAQDPALMQQFQKLSSSAAHAGDSEAAQKEFTETLTQTLSGLQENAEGLQSEVCEEDLSQAFYNMGLDGQAEGEFFPMMQGMMKMLLSKDVLYPSLKEISDKYPKWLSENRERTKQEEYDNYTKQHKIIQSICTEFESERETDSEETKHHRFDRLMDLMQQMQELGQPPKDIVGEMAPGLDFDENGMPKMPGLPTASEQCAIM